MIQNILKILNSADFIGQSEEIEIAKGKYKIPMSIAEATNQFKRELKWQKEK